MMSLFRKKIFFFHSLFLIVLASGFIWPNLYYWSLLVFNVIFLIFVLMFNSILLDKKRLSFFILPFLFINSLALYSSLLINKWLILGMILSAMFFSYYYFVEFRLRLNRDFDFNLGNFSVLSDVEGLLLVFLGASFIYSLPYFLNFKNWMLLIIIVLILFFAIWQNILIVNKQKQKQETLRSSFLFLLVLLPIVGSLFFLPFNFNVLGLILTLCYYTGLSFIRFHLSETLTNKKIKYNLIFIIVLLLTIFLTVRWR